MSIKTISSTKLRNNLSDALDSLTNEDVLVVSRRGKANKAIVDLDMLEDLLAANNPEYLKEIELSRAEAKRGEVFTIEDVFGGI